MHTTPRQRISQTVGFQHTPLLIRTFGHVRCVYHNVEMTKQHWRSQRARDLFLLLVSHDGHQMARGVLCEMLWPDCAGESSANNLRVSLYRLRQAFANISSDTQCVGADNQTVWLNLAADTQIDVDEFRLAVASARRMHDARQALPHLRRAADCYHGHFLMHYTDLEWTFGYREQFACDYTEIGIRLGQILLAMHLYTELIERMWRMIQLELAVESAHQLLIQAYQATGNQEMVRRVYHSCEHLVKHHMGSGVTAETTRLYRRVMSS
jgi:DNA-binding SARP family transcriptional activator